MIEVWPLLLAMVALGPLVLEGLTRRLDGFNFKNLFFIYLVIQLSVSSLLTLYWNLPSEFNINFYEYRDSFEKAYLIGIAGVCMFHVGYYLQSAKPFQMAGFLRKEWIRIRVISLCVSLVVVGYIAFAGLMHINGGMSEFLAKREAWRAGGMVGQGFFIFPATYLCALGGQVFFLNSVSKSRNKRAFWLEIFFFTVSIFPAIFLGFR